jgi:hypothetical protein
MAYDISVALRRFKNLIRWAARYYAIPGHFRRSSEELEAEGLLILVQCCREFPEDQIFFARYFKRALYNRLKDISRFDRTSSRDGVEVQLEEAEQLAVEYDFTNHIRERAEGLYPILSNQAQTFLKTLIDSPVQVSEYAWRDYCRRHKLASQGQSVTGVKSFRIKLRHIRGCLGMCRGDVRRVVKEIRNAVVDSEGG